MSLEGKVAIVTGASRGIGKTMAVAFAKAGADVVVAARTASEGGPIPGTIYETAAAIKALGRRALAVKTDVSDDEEVEQLAKQTLEEFGRADILVNNAAALFRAPILDTPIARWDLMNRVNLRATFLCIKAFLPAMVEQRWGHIINVSPRIRTDIGAGSLAQQVHKMGITILSSGLSKELEEHNIAVNCLWPQGQRDSEGMLYVYRGARPDWLSTQITADAALHILSHEPSQFTGRAVTDLEVMEEMGVSDLSRYKLAAPD